MFPESHTETPCSEIPNISSRELELCSLSLSLSEGEKPQGWPADREETEDHLEAVALELGLATGVRVCQVEKGRAGIPGRGFRGAEVWPCGRVFREWRAFLRPEVGVKEEVRKGW